MKAPGSCAVTNEPFLLAMSLPSPCDHFATVSKVPTLPCLLFRSAMVLLLSVGHTFRLQADSTPVRAERKKNRTAFFPPYRAVVSGGGANAVPVVTLI